jgi:hypothetical protein
MSDHPGTLDRLITTPRGRAQFHRVQLRWLLYPWIGKLLYLILPYLYLNTPCLYRMSLSHFSRKTEVSYPYTFHVLPVLTIFSRAFLCFYR